MQKTKLTSERKQIANLQYQTIQKKQANKQISK